jgi:hypothetical protein
VIELIKAAVAMGWPALGILVALMFYFKASISDPVANKRAVFKTFIGTIGAMLLFYGYRQLQDEFLRRVQAFARVFGSDYVYDVHDGALFHEYQRLAENRRIHVLHRRRSLRIWELVAPG